MLKRRLLPALLLVLALLLVVLPVAARTPDGEALPASGQAADPNLTLTKTAVAATGCRNYQVTLGIQGTPPSKKIDCVLVIDVSGSMDDGPSPTPLESTKTAAINFANQLLATGSDNKVGVVKYGGSTSVVRKLTNSASQVATAINGLSAGGSTNIEGAIVDAHGELESSRARADSLKVIVLMSDGVANDCEDWFFWCDDWPEEHDTCTENAIDAGQSAQHGGQWRVFTIGLLGMVHADHPDSEWVAADTLRQIQNAGYFQTYNNPDLQGIYDTIRTELVPAASSIVVTDQIASAFQLDAASIVASQGTTSVSGSTITWTAGTVGSNTITLTYNVAAKAGYSGNQAVNTSATMAYTNAAGTGGQSQTFPVPTVNVPTVLTVSAGADKTTHSGAAVQIGGSPTASGGTTSYTYSWSPATGLSSTTAANPNASPAGTTTYELTVTDAAGCTGTDSVVVTVVANNAPVANNDTARTCLNTPVAVNVLSNDTDSDGTLNPATVTVTDAPAHGSTSVNTTTGAVTYTPAANWSGSDTFKYTVKDNDGATSAKATVTVNVSPAVGVSVSADNAELNCNNADSLLTANVTSGTAPYTFKWFKDNVQIAGAASATYTATQPGQYKVTVTDNYGCTGTSANLAVSQVANPSLSIVADATVLGCSNNDVLFTATANGGEPAYTYEWYKNGAKITGAANRTYTATTTGTYKARVIDNNNCAAWSNEIVVTAIPTPSVGLAADDAELDCNNADALLTATASGGTSPYTYEWYKDSARISGAGNSTYTAPAAGVYQVVITDHNGCTATSSSVTIVAVPNPALSIAADDAELNCKNSDTLFTATVTGGEATYSYQWYKNGAKITGANGTTYTATAAGVYKAKVTDGNSCTAWSNEITVTSVPNPAATLAADDAELNCNNADTLLTTTVTGGEAPFTFVWTRNGTTITGAADSTYTATTAGTYKVMVTDHNGCKDWTSEIDVTSVPNPVAGLTVDDAELNCNNPDALLTLSVTGGESPFTYTWYKDGAAISGAAASTYTATAAGVFKVVITDHNGCTATSGNVTITAVPNPSLSITADDAELNCNNSDTRFSAIVTGGEATFSYEWYKDGAKITGAGGTTYTATTTGTFKARVTDGNNCTAWSNEITVTSVPNPAVTLAADDAELNCNNADTLLTATVTGGESPFTYNWYKDGVKITGAAGSTYTATEPGKYKVLVGDANTCAVTSLEVSVSRVTDPTASLSVDDPELNCNHPLAHLNATVHDGEGPFTYVWYREGNPVASGQGLAAPYTDLAGVWKAVVTDRNGCTATTNELTITRVANPSVTIAADDAEMNCSNRDVLLTATAGAGETPYRYQWYKDGASITSANSATYTATAAGVYKVVVTDNNGCSATSELINVVDVPNPSVSIAADDVELNCNNGDSLLTATPHNGEAPYSYQWYKGGAKIDGATQPTYAATTPGDYRVTVTDNNACLATSNTVTVLSVTNPSVQIAADDPEMNCANRDTALVATPRDGETPFTFAWYKDGSAIGGAAGASYTATAAGVYKVVLTDNNGCSATSNEITVVDLPNPAVSITSATVDQCTAIATFTAAGAAGEAPYAYAWDMDGDGQYDDATGATATYHLPADGSYTVKVQLTDNNTCKATAQATVTLTTLQPSVEISQTVDKPIVHEGDTVTFFYTITNTGQCALLNVGLSVDVSTSSPNVAHAAAVNVPLTGLTDQDGDGTPDDLAAGASATGQRTTTWTATANSEATVTGSNFAGQTFTDDDEDPVTVVHPAIALVKRGPKNAYEGDTVTYVFTVTNTSPDTVLTNVTVNDPLLGGTVWGPQTLAIGQSASFTANYTVPAGAANPLANTATARGTDILGLTVTTQGSASLYVLRPLGFKFNDTEGDGRYQSYADPLLGGWQITLLNEQTRASYRATTAASGQFFGKWFAPKDMPAGRYWVEEVQRTGWTQTFPGQVAPGNAYEIDYHADGTYTLLSAAPAGFAGLSFGNYEGMPTAADCSCVDWLVFSSNRDGNWELYGSGSDGSGPVRLTNSPAVDMAPSLRNASTVDRTLVAFQSDRDGKWNIYTVDTMGGAPKRLTWLGKNTDPVWSPDCNSAYLAFVSDRDGNQEIYVMYPDGNNQVRLTNDAGADTDPTWGPNAGAVAFQSNRTGTWQIYRVDRTGANLKRLTSDNADNVDPAWSPDGKWIAFRSNRDGQWNTYIMPAAGGEAIRLSAGGDNVGAVWSPDSSKLAYQSSRDGKWQVYVVDVNSKVESRVVTDTANDEWATWSCTSDGLVFQTDRSGNWELVYYGLDGQQRAQTTDNPGADVYPAWNPAEEDGSLFGMDVMVPAPAAVIVPGGIKPATPKATPAPQRNLLEE